MGSKNERTLQILEEEKEIRENRIIAEKDGEVYVTFHDASVLNSANAMEGKGTGLQMRNPDGSVASTGKTVHAINPDFHFANRYRVKKFGSKEKLYIVCAFTPDGFRLIEEQKSGRCFIKTIPVAVISRDADTKELVLEKMDTITESEFISDFKKELKNEDMAKIVPLIVNRGIEASKSEMPI